MDFFTGADSPTPDKQLYDKDQLIVDDFATSPELDQPIDADEMSEEDLLKEFRTPLVEPEQKQQSFEPPKADDPFKIDSDDLKRIGKLNKISSKGIVKLIDGGVSFAASAIAQSDDIEKYKANEEALDDLSSVIDEILPKEKTFIPSWGQVVIFFLLAFMPIILMAFSDRKRNKETKALQAKTRKLKRQNRELQMQIDQRDLEKELKTKEAELAKTDGAKEASPEKHDIDNEMEQTIA